MSSTITALRKIDLKTDKIAENIQMGKGNKVDEAVIAEEGGKAFIVAKNLNDFVASLIKSIIFIIIAVFLG